jgi:hypothetical protein
MMPILGSQEETREKSSLEEDGDGIMSAAQIPPSLFPFDSLKVEH